MSFVDVGKLKITAWSYSRLKTWEECPLKAKLKFLQRLPEPDSPYAARGTELHARAAAFIEGKEGLAPMSPLERVKKYLEPFQMQPGVAVVRTELQRGLTKLWEATEWFGPSTWLRVIYDVHKKEGGKVSVRDHKSGKIKEEEHADQLDLYATSALAEDPTADEANVAIIYIDHGVQSKVMTLTRKGLEVRKEAWNERANKMLSDDIFAPRPNPGCKWCHFRKSNGGPCQFG